MKIKRLNVKIGLTVFAVFLWTAITSQCCVIAKDIADIKVQDKSTVTGKRIFLGDIASIQGDLDSISGLENIALGRAPFPGKSRNLKRQQIIAKLKLNKVNLNKVNIVCQEEVTIISDYVEFLRDDIEKITRRFILDNMPWDPEMVKIEDFVSKKILLPKGSVSYSFSSHDKKDYIGRFNTSITFRIDGVVRKKAHVSAHIQVISPVAVSGRYLDRHSIISMSDIEFVKKDVTHIANKAVINMNDIVGKRCKGRIPAETVLKHSMFELAPVVNRGVLVTIVVETELLRITVPGEVMENGCMGDIVKVANLSTNKKIYGIVKNSREIEVRH
jgi:flagella basal body P-ring formation protein FlgA